MSTNKRRHANAVPIASFATWIVIALFTAAGGLGYVWCKNQLHITGVRIKTLERELADLQTKNAVARVHIASLTSTDYLQKKFDSGFIKLTKITDDRIVAIRSKAGTESGNELRPVSNPGGRK